MTEGTTTYHGLAAPLRGEYEQFQVDPLLDMVTLTIGATSTADFMVMQNSTGTELFVISASGAMTLSNAPAMTISSSGQIGGFIVNVTSTGAIATGATQLNAFLVNASSISELNSVVAYDSTQGAEVGSCKAFLAVHGSKAPTHLVSVGSTAIDTGAAGDNGFVEVATRFLSAPSTSITYGALKVLMGSKEYYVPMVPDTGMADT